MLIGFDFDRPKVGREERFVEEMGEQGPQASRVRLVGEGQVTG